MNTLGRTLALNRARLAAHETSYEEERAAARGPDALANFMLVKAFFAEAIETLSKAIESGETKIEIRLGFDGQQRVNDKVETLLLNGGYSDPRVMERLDSQNHPYFCLWRDFKDWAAANELKVRFEPRHCGGGIHSWLGLTCQPDVELERRRPPAPRG